MFQPAYLFSRADAPVDLLDQSTADHLEQNDSSPRIKYLFGSSSI